MVRSKVKTLKFVRAKFQLFKELVNEIPWVTVLMNRGTDQAWQVIRLLFLAHKSSPAWCVGNQAGQAGNQCG